MRTLADFFSLGVAAYRLGNSIRISGKPDYELSGLEVRGSETADTVKSVPYSNFLRPLDSGPGRISGYGRGWGQASTETQHQIMEMIIEKSNHLSSEDQALLLAVARVESGFNPDAAAKTTSASGVFQLIKSTADKLGVNPDEIFDAEKNIAAGIRLYEENKSAVEKRYPGLSCRERAIMIYAYHHDGPSLSHGGKLIAMKQVLPFLDDFRAVTYPQKFAEAY